MSSTISPTHPHNFANLKCSPSTLICREKTVIFGDVTIGTDCIIHPTAYIVARDGPIIIGNSNLIEERVSIINKKAEPLVIGDHNVFEVDSSCEAIKIGDHNILESKSKVSDDIELKDNCIIGAGCVLSNIHKHDNEIDDDKDKKVKREFPSNSVICGKNMSNRVVSDLPPSSHSSQLDFLRKILPNYQKLWRPPGLPLTPQQQR